jgi:hypothetical protein
MEAKQKQRCCPACGHYFIPWRTWRISRWSCLPCPKCGTPLNRRLDMQLVLVFLTMYICCMLLMAATFYGLPFAISIALIFIIFVVTWLVDVLTVRLVVAGRWRGLFGYEIPGVDVMSNPKTLKVVIAILVIAFLALFAFLADSLWQNFWWKKEVAGLAYYRGAERADHDFHDGKIRLFVISGERDDDVYSGTNEGPFQIWLPQYYPILYSSRYSTEQMVSAYNKTMKLNQNAAAKSLASTNSQSDVH